MAISTSDILSVLNDRDIFPEEPFEPGELPGLAEGELPDIGEIHVGETVYSTSLSQVFANNDEPETDFPPKDDPRFADWWREVLAIIEGMRQYDERGRHAAITLLPGRKEPPEPHCAWYCPIHFFGHGWGIYIRESCILDIARDISFYVDWKSVHASPSSIARQLLRSAFYVLFLHEQFHHKVESLGLRYLIATGTDHYRPYKANVYRPLYLSSGCLEESLANAESYRCLSEIRYTSRTDTAIRAGLRRFLEVSFRSQPPGYAEAVDYLSYAPYRDGLHKLQSQALDGVDPPSTPPIHWQVAPNMITALMDISDDIYVVLPVGVRPIFRPASIDPGLTVSSRALEGALIRHYGYYVVSGGKGSHVKLKKPGAPTIIIPGGRPVLSPGIVKHALNSLGPYPVSRLPDLLEGKLAASDTSRFSQL